MNFIQQAYKGKSDGWRYIVGTVIVLFFWQFIGIIPLIGSMLIKFAKSGNIELLSDLNNDTIMKVFDSNLTLLLLLLMFAIGLMGLFYVVKQLHQQTIISLTTSRTKIDWKRVFFSFSLWGSLVVIFTLLAYFMSPDDFVWNFDLNKFLILAIIAIIFIPIQTSFEEYLFRGYLMQGLGVLAKNRWLPLLTTSVVFGLMHFANPEVEKLGSIIMVYYIGTGFLLGIMTLMDEGLELALGFHAANNLISALLITTDWTAFQTHAILKDISEPSADFDILFPVLILFPIVLFIFSKKYGWTNWTEKLTGKVEEVSVIKELV